jgi:hypothetical protein
MSSLRTGTLGFCRDGGAAPALLDAEATARCPGPPFLDLLRLSQLLVPAIACYLTLYAPLQTCGVATVPEIRI